MFFCQLFFPELMEHFTKLDSNTLIKTSCIKCLIFANWSFTVLHKIFYFWHIQCHFSFPFRISPESFNVKLSNLIISCHTLIIFFDNNEVERPSRRQQLWNQRQESVCDFSAVCTTSPRCYDCFTAHLEYQKNKFGKSIQQSLSFTVKLLFRYIWN